MPTALVLEEKNKIRTIAVTGTNGKTSTVELARQLMVAAGHRPASLGTLGLKTDFSKNSEPLLIGKDAIPELVTELRCYQNIDIFLYEAFSASIAARLYDELPLDVAVLTNIGEDHLECHGTQEEYEKAKLRLFSEILKSEGTALYNADDISAVNIEAICRRRNMDTFTFGINCKADLKLTHKYMRGLETHVGILFKNQQYKCKVPFDESIFLSNWLAALAIGLQCNIELESLLRFSQNLLLPPGRLELVGRTTHKATIYVDYANNADALKAVLDIVQRNTTGKVRLVFGCGGGKHKSKRTKMGRIAHENADVVYVTDDNAREEDPKRLRMEIIEHCPQAIEIGNRKKAIENAIRDLCPKDTLLIAGKGHENHQEINGVKTNFSDKKTVLEYLNTVSKNKNYELQLS